MADGKVTILVDVDGNKVKVLNDELDKVAQKGDKGSGALKKFALGGAVFQLASKGIQLMSESLGDAIKRFDTLKSYPRVMKAMGHSSEDVARSTKKLANGIEGLPTTLNEVVGTAQRLTSITGDINRSTDLTIALNNAFLASGASSADASRGLQQYAQMLSAGKVDMQSWKTLQETMPYALQKTAESFGFAGASAQNDFYAALKNGQVSFDDFSKRLIKLNDGVGGFAELAKENSKGIGTSFSNMKNAVVKGVANVIEAMDDLSKAVTGNSIAENFDLIKHVINAAFSVIVSTIKASTPIFKVLFEVLKSGVGVAQTLAPAILGLTAAIVTMKAANDAILFTKGLISAWKNFTSISTLAITMINTMATAQAAHTTVTKAQAFAQLATNGGLSAASVLYGVATGAISLQTAATIAATAATTAFKAALTALTGPVGWVVAGVSALVGIGVAAWQWLTRESEETKKLKAEQEGLVKSTQNLTDSVKQSTQERQKNLESVKGNSKSYQKLAEEVVQLASKTRMTAGEKKNLKEKIDALNSSVEGLNLAYDKNTGSLSQNKDQIMARISAMEAESTWQTAQQNLMEIEQKRSEINEQLAKNAEARTRWNETANVSDGVRKERINELNEEEKKLKETQAQLQTEYEKTSQVQQAAADAMAVAAEDGKNRQVLSYAELSEAQQKAVDSMRAKYDELLATTTNMFDQIQMKSAISVDEMIANLQRNQEAVNSWSANLDILAQRGVDQGILERMRQMGPQGGLYVQELVNASDEKLATLNETFRAGGESAMNGMTAGMDTGKLGVDQKVKDLVTSQANTLQAEIAAADFAGIGKKMTDDVAQGAEQGADKAGQAASRVGDKMKEAFQSNMGIHSPSRVFAEYGGHITDGLAQGVDQGADKAVQGITQMADKMKQQGQRLVEEMKQVSNNINNAFSSLPGQLQSAGSNAGAGLYNGLAGQAGALYSLASSIANNIASTIRRALDIHSPSRVMRDQVGRFIPQGIAVGIEADQDVIDKAMLDLKESMMIDPRPEVAFGLQDNLSKTIQVKGALEQAQASAVSNSSTTNNNHYTLNANGAGGEAFFTPENMKRLMREFAYYTNQEKGRFA